MFASDESESGAIPPPYGIDYRLVFESLPGLFMVLRADSPRFTILAVTDAFARGSLRQRESIVGLGIFDAFPDNPDDPEASGVRMLQASLERVLATREPDTMAVQKYDIALPEAAGGGFEERHWSPVNVPVFAADGRIAYIVQRVEDVTEFVRVARSGKEFQERSEQLAAEILRRSAELDASNQKLRAMNERLTELDRAKSLFFSNISHEFRTPLTLLLGPVEQSLQDPALDARHRAHLTLVQHNGLRLLRLVDDLLDFVRIEGGRLSAAFTQTDLSLLTAEMASMFQSAVDRAGLRLVIDCPPQGEPAWVDRGMWEKIVLNLLSNAFKFTLEGEIAVRLRRAGETFVLSVSDTGAGIEQSELARVFDRFHRVQGVAARTHEGAGIGLALVQELVRLHGGTVSVESAPGRGSTFTVSIPAGRDHLPEGDVATSPAPQERSALAVREEAYRLFSSGVPATDAPSGDTGPKRGAAAARVLLVDDSVELRSYIGELLAPHYEVEAVPDGLAALEAIRDRLPDLVLSDIMMPRLDGFGLLRQLRADPLTKAIPVILLSARAGEDASIDGLEIGADDYLMKPFSARELLARVRAHLEINRSRRHWMRELQRANEELDAFNQSVAHDLRSPLTTITGYSSILLAVEGSNLDEEQRRQIEKIQAAASRMATLIDDLMSLARVNRSAMQVETVDLSQIATTVIGRLREAEPSRNATVEIPAGLRVKGDSRLLTIALDNLLGNAWKYSAKRSVARIELGELAENGERVFFVRDNGAGFDMAYAHKLFLPFERLHLSSEFSGTGIGLTTVRRAIERHDGRVWVTAAPDEGATFFFTIDESESRYG